jgi:transcriptional regulator with XRE-family HTH domain
MHSGGKWLVMMALLASDPRLLSRAELQRELASSKEEPPSIEDEIENLHAVLERLGRAGRHLARGALYRRVARQADLMARKRSAATIALGAALRSARVLAGYTQASLAERAGIGRNYYGALERGEHDPTFETLYKVADALGVRLGDLVGRARASGRWTGRPDLMPRKKSANTIAIGNAIRAVMIDEFSAVASEHVARLLAVRAQRASA